MRQFSSRVQDRPLFMELERSSGRDDIGLDEVKQLAGLVLSATELAGPLLEHIPHTFRQYTQHNIEHSRNLIDLMGRFIPAQTLAKLNALELAILLLAAILHDLGMFVSDGEKKAVLASAEFERYQANYPDRVSAMRDAEAQGDALRAEAIRGALLADYFRHLHPQRAAKVIAENFPQPALVFRGTDITERVMRIAESHGWGVLESVDPRDVRKSVANLAVRRPLDSVPVNEQYLACCLRLADIMDFDRSRTPMAVYRHLTFTEDRSWAEWNKHLQVSGWIISEYEAEYWTECTHPAFHIAVMEFLDSVDSELRDCRELVVRRAPAAVAERYKLHLAPAVERRNVEMADKSFVPGAFRFRLDFERIMQLLMDRSLYPDSTMFLRELLQNSLDACRIRMALAEEAGRATEYNPQIVVWDYSDVSDNPQIIFQDNGIGMSQKIIENYFMRVGNSYYRSMEFGAERSRLASKNITLDATSRFGIGFLSCFMVADRMVVETYRAGSGPLRITIDGFDKYFVLQMLDPPAQTDPLQTPPLSMNSGPPDRIGTRITLELRSVPAFDVFETLRFWASNVESPITVIRTDGNINRIEPTRWKHACDSLVQTFRPFERQLSALSEVTVAYRIPLEKFSFAQHLQGHAWFWMLRDLDGEPTLRRGHVQVIGGGLRLHSPEIALVKDLRSIPSGTRNIRKRIAAPLSSGGEEGNPFLSAEIPKYWRTRFNVDGWASTWAQLGPTEKAAVVRSMDSERPYHKKFHWWEHRQLLESLLEGTDGWSYLRIDLTERIAFSRHHQLALSGIALPAGIIEWQPGTASSSTIQFVPAGVSILIDYRDSESVRPSANRLFIDTDQGSRIAIPLLRAVLQEARAVGRSMLHIEKPDYDAWFRALCRGIGQTIYGPAVFELENTSFET